MGDKLRVFDQSWCEKCLTAFTGVEHSLRQRNDALNALEGIKRDEEKFRERVEKERALEYGEASLQARLRVDRMFECWFTRLLALLWEALRINKWVSCPRYIRTCIQ
jgi:hypothetical protein